jgi:hypothetical protein
MYVCVCEGGDRTRMHVHARARVALLIQYAMRMHDIVTSFVVPMASQHFSELSHKRYDFREKGIEYKMCAFIFSTTIV